MATAADNLEMTSVLLERLQPIVEGGWQDSPTDLAVADQRPPDSSAGDQPENEPSNRIHPDPATDGAGIDTLPPDTSGSSDDTSRFEIWQLRSNNVQVFLGVVGLIVVFALLKPQLEDHTIAELGLQLSRWTALKDYQDDCRSQLVCCSSLHIGSKHSTWHC
jgi:hypothetical protein